MACCIFMRLSLVAKRRLLVLILAIGAVLAVVLAVTRFDPIATTGGAPVSLLNSPDLATVGADKSAPFYNPKPVAEYTLPGTVRRVEDVAGAPPGIKVQRMVYVSQTAAGEAKEVSALFAVKDGAPPPPNGRPLITVAHGTSGVAPGCGISKEPFRLGSNGYFWWYFYTEPLVRAGYAVVMSDYGNLGTPGVSDYIVKNGAGADVLNAARAALMLEVRDIDANKVAIVGHSQGGYNALAAAQILGLLRLAKVHAARQFADHEDVNAIALPARREGAGMRQRLGQLHRAQVGEQAELLADAQQGRALGTFLLGNRRVTIGQTHRAKQNRIRLPA